MILQDAMSRAMVEYLTGTVSNYQRRVPNDLGRLAHSAALPGPGGAEPRPGDPVDGTGLERAIQRALAAGDPAEAWRLVALRMRVR